MVFVVFFFSEVNYIEKIFQESHQSVKQFGCKIRPQGFIRPDLGPNCLQRVSADDTNRPPYISGPISSMMTNKYGCRRVIMLGGVMSGVGLSISYFAPNLYYLFFTFGALAGRATRSYENHVKQNSQKKMLSGFSMGGSRGGGQRIQTPPPPP